MNERTEKKRRHWSRWILDAVLLVVIVGFLFYFWPARFGGSTSFIIVGGHSMEPTYDVGDIVITRKGSPQIGDVVAFDPKLNGANPPLVIHRIVGGDPNGWILQGDNNSYTDQWKPTNDEIVGVAQWRIAGGIRVLHVVTSPYFYAALAGIAAMVLLWPRRPTGESEPEEQGADEPPDGDGDGGGDPPTLHVEVPQDVPERRGRRAIPVGASSVIAVVVVMSALVSASAAALGVTADDLTAMMIPGDRCDDVISVEPLADENDPLVYDRAAFSNVAPACNGLDVAIVVKDSDGFEIAFGSAIASSPDFIVNFNAPVGLADYDGVALAINGWGIPTEPVGGGATSNMTLTSNWQEGFCASVTVSTSSPTPIPWTSTLDLSTYPFNGAPNQVDNVNWTFEAPVLYATPMPYNATVVVGSPVVWGFCALRDTPPPPGDVSYEPKITTDWGAGYCAEVTVTTNSPTPIIWVFDFILDTAPFNGNPYDIWNAISDQPRFTNARGAGWNDQIDVNTPRVWGFCADR